MNRNFGLDIIRTVSIWLVLLQHIGVSIPGLSYIKIGSIGVEVFFVLSGFLIGGILFRDLDKGQPFGRTIFGFWIRRWFRILPLYYGVLLFKFIAIDHSIGWNILYYFGFLQNNFYGIDFYNVSWSLVIEEWFYLFAPLFLITVCRSTARTSRIFVYLLAFLLFENILRFSYVYFRDVPFGGVNGNFPFRFDTLFLGVTLAFMQHHKMKLFERMQSLVCFLAGALILTSYIYYFRSLCTPVNLIESSLFVKSIGFFILSFGIALMIPYASKLSSINTEGLLNKTFYFFFTYTSLLTYAIYLLHPLVFEFIHSDHIQLNDPAAETFISILATYLAAFLVYRYFETPFLKMREVIVGQLKK